MPRNATDAKLNANHLPTYDSKRRDIIAGAARVFDRRGYATGTTKEIAAEVGLSQPAIYHYVGSKEVILGEIALQVAVDMMAAYDLGIAQGVTPREQFVAIVRELARAVIRNQVEFAVYWKEQKSFPSQVRSNADKGERLFMSQMRSLVVQLQSAGDLPADADAIVLTEAIIGMVCWSYHWYRPARSPSPEVIAKTFCDLIGLD